jgi:hypothetical protein
MSHPTRFLDASSEVHRELALGAVAAYPTPAEAVAFLESQGYTTTEEHLRVWRDIYLPDQYHEIREQLTSQIEARAASDMFDGARVADQVVNFAVARVQQHLAEDRLKDPEKLARVARDLQQVASQKIEKSLTVQGRPSRIVEHHDPDAILRKLEALGVVVDDAEELPSGDTTIAPAGESRSVP